MPDMSDSINKTPLQIYLAVGLGGMIGSVLRYIVSLLFHPEIGLHFPWSTLLVNLSGAFLLSFLLFQPTIKSKINSIIFIGLTTGVLGSFTTFSMIMIEIVSLWQNTPSIAIIYCLVTLIGGIICSLLGYLLAKKVSPL